MASTANQQQPFPAVPPSFSAGDHEMRDYPPAQETPRPLQNHTPYLKPYLGLRARLSQIWINRWTLLLLLVLIRLLFAIASTNTSITSARREALSACTQVENIGSSMASMPHFMSKGLNDMTATGIEKGVHGLMSMLDLSVSAVEEIVVFVIHMMTSTYLCLITLAVTGSLHAVAELGEEVNKVLNTTIDGVTDGIGSATKEVTDGINSLLDKVNLPFFNGGNKPQINLDDEINKLKSLQVPPEMQKGLEDLKNNIPKFEDVQNFTDNVIRLPFEEIKKLISGMNNFTFDRDLLPVPQKEQLDFCSEGNSINDFFDDLINIGITAKRVALGVLIVAAVVVIIPMAIMEIRRYRRMEQRAALFEQGYEPMDVVYLASRPTSSTIGMWFGRRFGSARRQAIMRWAWSYATSVPMLFLLSLAIAGLFSCFCQYLLLKKLEAKVPELTNEVADFAGKVVTKLNNASMSWSGGVNGMIGDLDSEINDKVFGWVNTSTTAVNDTLNTFVEKTSETLDKAFGDTILKDAIKDVLNCLIGLKIAGIQKGLTWVHDHAHIDFPGVKNDTLSLQSLAEHSNSSTANELIANPNGKAKDEVSEAIDHVIDSLMSGIRTEALISTTLFLIWLTIAIVGLIYACTHMARRETPQGTAYEVDPDIDNRQKPQEYPTDAAPPSYNAAPVPHSLETRQFRAYGPNDNDPDSEKFGRVDTHTISDSARPGHARTSSHGHFAEPSPLDEKADPFSDPYPNDKKNPFSDPSNSRR